MTPVAERLIATGDRVLITYEGRTVPGAVVLASPNGRSLMLSFEAILGGYVGMMPVLRQAADDVYRDVFNQNEVTVKATDA